MSGKGMSRTKSLLDLEERMTSMEEWRAQKDKEEEDEDTITMRIIRKSDDSEEEAYCKKYPGNP